MNVQLWQVKVTFASGHSLDYHAEGVDAFEAVACVPNLILQEEGTSSEVVAVSATCLSEERKERSFIDISLIGVRDELWDTFERRLSLEQRRVLNSSVMLDPDNLPTEALVHLAAGVRWVEFYPVDEEEDQIFGDVDFSAGEEGVLRGFRVDLEWTECFAEEVLELQCVQPLHGARRVRWERR